MELVFTERFDRGLGEAHGAAKKNEDAEDIWQARVNRHRRCVTPCTRLYGAASPDLPYCFCRGGTKSGGSAEPSPKK